MDGEGAIVILLIPAKPGPGGPPGSLYHIHITRFMARAREPYGGSGGICPHDFSQCNVMYQYLALSAPARFTLNVPQFLVT